MGSTAIGSIRARPSCCSPEKREFIADLPDFACALRRPARAPRAAEPSSRQRSASSRQSAIRSARIWRLSAGTAAGTTDSSRTPKPMKIGTARAIGRNPAANGDQLAGRRAGAAVAATNCSTAGCKASVRPASCAWPRSMASVYCVRSLLPIDRKSASRSRAACGQRGRRRFDHRAELDAPRSCRARALSLIDDGAHGIDFGDVGDHRHRAAARRRRVRTRSAARSWVRSRSGRASAVRTPRMPERRILLRPAAADSAAACRRRRP